jgi:ribonuclease P protein component
MVVHVSPLKGFEAFSALFQRGIKFSAGRLSAFFVFRPLARTESSTIILPATLTIECGVTSKRRTRPAVMRNRVKRLLRETLRQTFAHFPLRLQLNSEGIREPRAIEMIPITCVVVWQEIPAHPQQLQFKDVQADVALLYEKILRHCKSAQYPAERTEQSRPHTPKKKSPAKSQRT